MKSSVTFNAETDFIEQVTLSYRYRAMSVEILSTAAAAPVRK